MAGMNWDELTPEERLIAEQSVLNLRELNRACDAAADGEVLKICETLALEQGRDLIRRVMTASLQSQADAVEKKGPRAGRAPADERAVTAVVNRGG
jgi:hypothetical protein